ncbi:hypothetical protein B0H15DRAFT_947789 [Mycena belliarum]|uniref:Uncharacterized protein n=1 Tax=Mycena belliarum TaxID=1033014 RepID=A0AAD6XU86_9AGAR|nr:hypothetical protein B0H15DRAFT_947789 [Mycena belliae]
MRRWRVRAASAECTVIPPQLTLRIKSAPLLRVTRAGPRRCAPRCVERTAAPPPMPDAIAHLCAVPGRRDREVEGAHLNNALQQKSAPVARIASADSQLSVRDTPHPRPRSRAGQVRLALVANRVRAHALVQIPVCISVLPCILPRTAELAESAASAASTCALGSAGSTPRPHDPAQQLPNSMICMLLPPSGPRARCKSLEVNY